MAYKIAVEDKVIVTVKGKLLGAAKGRDKPFEFTLLQDRLDQEQINERMNSGEKIVDFIVSITHGWEGQRLVLNDDGSPADFSEDALRALLGIASMGVKCYQSYLADVGVQEKNSR
jgi:hypothetical protein